MEVHRHPARCKVTESAERALLRELCVSEGRNVVTAAAAPAVGAGLRAFAQGGNAFDAAISACLMEAVAVPMKCGLGGDLVGLVSSGGEPEALVSIGPGVAALAGDVDVDLTGPTSVGVPGAAWGYAALAARGRLGLAALAAPAVEAAEAGLRWNRIGVALTAEAEALLRRYNGPIPFLPDGRLPHPGERLRLPGLARLLRVFAERGAALWAGAEGERLAARVQAAGGLLAAADLRADPARWAEPARLDLEGAAVWATPAPTHGPSLLRALSLVREEGVDPVAAARQAREELRRAGREPLDEGTSVVTAADREGNSVVVVHSTSFPRYGSGLIAEEWDLVLNNRPGRGFSKNVPKAAANAPAPGRVPATTLHAWAIARGETRHIGATPGGINQMAWNLQTVLACLDGADIGDTVLAPRWGLDDKDQLVCEADHPRASGGGSRLDPLSQRSATQILMRTAAEPEITAAADPRIGGRTGAL